MTATILCFISAGIWWCVSGLSEIARALRSLAEEIRMARTEIKKNRPDYDPFFSLTEELRGIRAELERRGRS